MWIALNLIAMAFGYKVLAAASKEKGGLKMVGQLVAMFILILAFASSSYAVLRYAKYRNPNCPMMVKLCHLAGNSGK